MREADNINAHAREARLGTRGGLLILAAALCVYVVTAQRGVSWQDSGEFQWRCLNADFAGTMGLARAHPLYIAVGTLLARLSGPALPFALNAFSGLGMAIALATFAALATRLSRSVLAGGLMAALLGVSHMAWWLSTIAEVYTWSLAALAAELYCLMRLLEKPGWRWLSLLALANGLHLCIHNFALLAWPVYLGVIVWLLVRKQLPARALLPAVGAWLLGAGLYVGMTVDLAIQTGSVVHAIRSALVGDYAGQVANVAQTSKHFKANLALTAMSFTSPMLALAILGWWRMRHWSDRGVAAAIGAITAIHVLFFVRYPVPDQATFVLPSLMLIALTACAGLARLLERPGRWRKIALAAMLISIFGQPLVFVAATQVARRTGADRRQRELPFRDEARYWLIPWKHNETSAARFAAAAFDQVDPGALILPDSTSVYPLMTWQTLQHARLDVAIQYEGRPLADPSSRQALLEPLKTRPVYVVAPARGEARFDGISVLPDGVLYRLVVHANTLSRR